MDHETSISVVVLRPLVNSIERLGADGGAFLRAVGVEGERDFDAFVPTARVERRLATLAEGLRKPSLGLEIALAAPMGCFGTLDHAVWTGGNLRDALSRASHLYGLVSQGIALALEEQDDIATLRLRAPCEAGSESILTDLALALTFLRAREATHQRLRLRAVHFRHPVSDPTPYETFFETEVTFGAPVDEVVFDAALLNVPVRTADADTDTSAVASVGATTDSSDSFLEEVRAAVLGGVRAKDAGLPRLANELGVTARTLQRQLQARGTSHREVVENVRRELAVQLLAREEPSITEVSCELGFAQLQSFYRAFARWTGTTPAAFRAASCGSPGTSTYEGSRQDDLAMTSR